MAGNKVVVQERGVNSLNCTIPNAISQAMRLKKGDEVEFVLVNGEVCLRRV